MAFGQILYITLWMAMAAGLVIASRRADSFVGRAVVIALIAYVLGGVMFGAYLREVRGRDYLAPDEQAFQVEAGRIVEGWRTGHAYIPNIPDGWPYVNAVILRLWGPSLVPMRLLNALVGAATVAATYWLAELVFASPPIGRFAVVLVLLSPSLFVGALTNLKERAVGLMMVLAIAATVQLIKRWSLPRLAGMLLAIYSLGELRHYYAPIVGWLAIIGFALCATSAWPRRLVQVAVMILSLGFVLQAVTGTFLGANTPYETATRFVSNPAPTPGPDPATYSRLGETAGRPEIVSRLDTSRFGRSVLFVLFGRFEARAGAGRIFEVINWPEWLANFLLFPLVCWVFVNSVLRRQMLPLLPIAFVATLVLVLAYTHGDDWTTLRFRVMYWPMYLMLAAAGSVQLHGSRVRRPVGIRSSSTARQAV